MDISQASSPYLVSINSLALSLSLRSFKTFNFGPFSIYNFLCCLLHGVMLLDCVNVQTFQLHHRLNMSLKCVKLTKPEKGRSKRQKFHVLVPRKEMNQLYSY